MHTITCPNHLRTSDSERIVELKQELAELRTYKLGFQSADEEAIKLEKENQRLEEQLVAMQEDLIDEKRKWKFRHERKIIEHNLRHEKENQRLEAELANCQEHRRLMLDNDAKMKTLVDLEADLDKANETIDDIREGGRQSLAIIESRNVENQRLQALLGKWISYDGHVCPSCGRPHGPLDAGND